MPVTQPASEPKKGELVALPFTPHWVADRAEEFAPTAEAMVLVVQTEDGVFMYSTDTEAPTLIGMLHMGAGMVYERLESAVPTDPGAD